MRRGSGKFTGTSKILVPVIVLIYLAVSLIFYAKPRSNSAEVGLATVEPEEQPTHLHLEEQLTRLHGEEVVEAIENFHTHWLSLETHLNPARQKDLATSQFLGYRGYVRDPSGLAQEPYWLVTTSAQVTEVRVFEFNPRRFKASACVKKTLDEVTTIEAELINHKPPLKTCMIYVFVREESKWKVAAYFNTADPRDWQYVPDWLRETIGELPDP